MRELRRGGRLALRTGAPASADIPRPGVVDVPGGRLLVPPPAPPAAGWPLLVALHGAGGSPQQMLTLVGAAAQQQHFLVLALRSAASTWDVILGGFGPDVLALETALQHAVDTVPVDEGRLALAGFSDGASYALSLGLGNGDVFGHVIAWSPGFLAPAALHGRPGVFVSHGERDDVLPIEQCSRRIVPQLRQAGYDVDFVEFDGPHEVPAGIVDTAVGWWLCPS